MERIDGISAERVYIFDTTLRDGQQCPGAGMSPEKNIEYARLAAEASIDVVEAGFPSASDTDFKIVREIAAGYAAMKGAPVICGLSQLRPDQVARTMEALEPAKGNARVHIYLPVDPNLMAASLGARRPANSDLIKLVNDEVGRCTKEGFEVEFSPEGYSRVGEHFEFCGDLISAAVDGGASVINCPDTIGGASVLEGETYFVRNMIRHKERIDSEFRGNSVVWSTHCHNDLGLALANSIEAVFRGPARQIEGCINGIGERAGNVSLEQCIMVIECFGRGPAGRFRTGVNTAMLRQLSDFVSKHMLPRQPHWPVCGENAARHSSGGHTNAIINDPLAYQPFDPRRVGKNISFVFGPLSGSNHAQKIIEDAGFVCGESEKTVLTQYIKDLYADRRKGITDEELLEGYKRYRSPIALDQIDYAKVRGKVQLTISGKFFDRAGEFHEEVESADSALTALKELIDRFYPGLELTHYASQSSDPSIHALGLSTIILRDAGGLSFEGHGTDRDTQLSAMKALIDATNVAYIAHNFRRPAGARSDEAAA